MTRVSCVFVGDARGQGPALDRQLLDILPSRGPSEITSGKLHLAIKPAHEQKKARPPANNAAFV